MTPPHGSKVSVVSLVCLVCTIFVRGEVEVIGERLRTSTEGMHDNSTIYLLGEEFPKPALLFAIGSYYIADTPTSYQLWRPVEGKTFTFRLVDQWLFSPRVVHGIEIHYFYPDVSCVRVQPGDMMALQSIALPASVARHFSYDRQITRSTKATSGDPGDLVGVEIQFDSLPYPYLFSTAAYVDTDLSKYGNGSECPPDLEVTQQEELLTPAITTPLPTPVPVTPAKGDTGEKGDKGDVGEQGVKGERGEQGDRGLQGARGKDGLEVQSRTGRLLAAMGLRGDMGSKGAQGSPGEQGPRSQHLQIDLDCKWCKRLLTPTVILVLIIWLSLTTIAIVIISACFLLHKLDASSHFRRQPVDLWRKYEDDADVIGGGGRGSKEEGFENDSGAVLADEEPYEDLNRTVGRTVF